MKILKDTVSLTFLNQPYPFWVLLFLIHLTTHTHTFTHFGVARILFVF